MKQFLIKNSLSGVVTVVNSEANTLGELKTSVQSAGMDIKDLDFFELISKTEMMVDESLLPNVTTLGKDGSTINGIYLLTNSNKKTASGCDRNTFIDQIEDNDDNDDFYNEYGVEPYDACTDDLQQFCQKYHQVPFVQQPCANNCALEDMIVKLLGLLTSKGLISEAETKNILPQNPEEIFSSDQIDELASFLK